MWLLKISQKKSSDHAVKTLEVECKPRFGREPLRPLRDAGSNIHIPSVT